MPHFILRAGVINGIAVLVCFPASTQSLDLPNGPAGKATYSNQIRGGPPQLSTSSQTAAAAAAAAGVAFYTANYPSLGGKQLPFNIIGTDPSLGANTTTIPVAIVPLKFVFPSPGNPTLDATGIVPAVQNSPLFLSADYTAGGTDLGFTQFGDAVQRGEFWNLPGFSQNYHVLLGMPTIAPTVTVNVPAGQGGSLALRNGGLLGVLAQNFLNSLLNALMTSYTADRLPIFVTNNVFLSPAGGLAGCCVLGFHDSESGPIATAKTWIFSAYTQPGTFTGNSVLDVQSLSHEVAEWLNDPFVGGFLGAVNFIPPAVLPGTGGACIINFETGDPLEAPPVVFTKTTNATTYHLQDEVLLPWYLHSTPSFSVNGWYALMNGFTTFSTLCGPG